MPFRNYQQLRKIPDLRKETSTYQCQNLIGAVTHMRGWRKTMQDTDIFQFNFDGKGTHLFAVFDGHGGAQVAIFAKRHLKNQLLKNQWYQKGQYQQALAQIFPNLDALMLTGKGSEEVFQIKEELQQEIRKQYLHEWEESSDQQMECLAGSTAIVCLMTKEFIYIASVGDSRCMISTNNQCKILSIQHKPDLPDQKNRIQAAGGKVKNNRVNGLLGMSRSLGDFQFKSKKNRPMNKQMVISDPHIQKIQNKSIEFIMIGCDGVWQGHDDSWYFNFIHQRTGKERNPQKIVQEILDQVVAKDSECENGYDNMTALLILNKKTQNSQHAE